MVSGMFVPVLAAIFTKSPNAPAALASMISGGITTLVLIILEIKLPYKLDENIFGILVSLMIYILVAYLNGFNKTNPGKAKPALNRSPVV
jgi:SSS family solute:Na+ symporter